jgi:2-hydroxyglutarate dehydrogenase
VLSTETGIVDAHGLMENLESEIVGDLEDTDIDGQGSLVLGTKVVRLDPYYGGSSKFMRSLNAE